MTRAKKGFIKEMKKRNLASAKAALVCGRQRRFSLTLFTHIKLYELEYVLLYLCVKYIFWEA